MQNYKKLCLTKNFKILIIEALQIYQDSNTNFNLKNISPKKLVLKLKWYNLSIQFCSNMITMYQSSIPVFIRNLNNLSAILKKGATHAEAKKIDQSVFIDARLFPDMLPLSRQIQITSDTLKAGACRLAGIEIPSFEDSEKTFEELQERIAKTIKFLQTIKEDQINGTEDKKISYHQHGKDREFIGQPYLLDYILPNLYFHITTTYAILRHNGVEIGKKDYLG